ncbi:MAG: uridine kinase [Nitrososphaerota archaeon]|jgi:molybdenum storage protein|nr:uridine kinase [Nitrososphaerota archaeon]
MRSSSGLAESLGPSEKGFRLLPDSWVVKVGGQSIIDRGKAALVPVVDELTRNFLADKKVIIGTGAGTRARHIYSLAIEFGLPTGVLSALGAGVASQNARMVGWLLSKYGIPVLNPGELSSKLAFDLEERRAVVFPGMPPYAFWERYPNVGLIPPHRTDTGCYLVAETFGAAGMLYVKDEDGLYTDDPKKNPDAEFIPKASPKEVIGMKLPDLVIEQPVLEFMALGKHVRKIQIVNGLKPGNITRALRGEQVGTVIEA